MIKNMFLCENFDIETVLSVIYVVCINVIQSTTLSSCY